MTVDPFSAALAPRPKSIDLVEIIRVVRRRRVVILLTVVLVTAISAVFASTMTRTYTAVAVTVVAPPTRLAGDTTQGNQPDPQFAQRAATTVDILKSREIARRVAEKLDLADDPEFNPPKDSGGLKSSLMSLLRGSSKPPATADEASSDDSLRPVAQRLMAHIEVSREETSNVIDIAVTTRDPKKSAKIANVLARTFIESQKRSQVTSVRRNIDWLEKRVMELRQQLLNLEQSAASYRQRNRLLTDDSAEARAQIDRLDSHLAVARSARVEAEARFRELGSSLGGESPSTAVNSPVLSDLRSQEAALGRRIAELSTFYGSGHPDVVNATAQLDDVRARIAAETGRLKQGLRNEITVNRTSEQQLAQQIGALRSQALNQRGATVGLLDIERQADATNSLYVTLLSQLKAISDREKIQESDLSIVSEAVAPDGPNSPSPIQIVSAGFISSFVFAFFFAFGAETLDSRLSSPEQVERALGIPTLAMIPEAEGEGEQLPHIHQIERPRSTLAESVHDLHVELLLRRYSKPAQVVVMTSALPGEGKTTLTLSLAIAAANIGRKAVAIELDLRRPALQKLLDKPVEVDVIDYLTGAAELDAVLVPYEKVPNLWTIGLTRSAEKPRALLASPRLEELVKQLRERFDLIVISAPPVLPVTDARMLAGLADATLLVVRWNKTMKNEARAAVEILDGAVAAAVLNRVSYKKHARLAFGDRVEYHSKYSGYYAN